MNHKYTASLIYNLTMVLDFTDGRLWQGRTQIDNWGEAIRVKRP